MLKPMSMLATLLVAAAASAPNSALAQEDGRPQAIPESVLRPWSALAAREAPGAIASPEPIETTGDRAPRDLSWMKGAVQLIEQPRDPVTGAYKRPKIVIGVPSYTMKNWLKSSGIAAERCLLPMVRARAKLSEEGEASASLMLFARCNFY